MSLNLVLLQNSQNNTTYSKKEVDKTLCGPYLWIIASFWSLIKMMWFEWNFVTFWEQLLVGIVIVLIIVILDIVDIKKPAFVPKPVHFLMVGVARKYKHSCWAPSVMPSICLAIMSFIFSFYVALFLIALLRLTHPKKRHGVQIHDYITWASHHVITVLQPSNKNVQVPSL